MGVSTSPVPSERRTVLGGHHHLFDLVKYLGELVDRVEYLGLKLDGAIGVVFRVVDARLALCLEIGVFAPRDVQRERTDNA